MGQQLDLIEHRHPYHSALDLGPGPVGKRVHGPK